MDWVIVEFTDKTVASPSEKWTSVKDGRMFCKWPTKDVEKMCRADATPDNSKNWQSHECRLLMNGERFHTYDAAREAVIISQEHSTMSSYIKSKSSKRARKRPAKFATSESDSDTVRKRKSSKQARKRSAQFSTSDSETDSEQHRKIKSMRKSDSKITANAKKTYSYIHKTSTPLENTINESFSNNADVETEKPNVRSENVKSTTQPGSIVQNIAIESGSGKNGLGDSDSGGSGSAKSGSNESGSDESGSDESGSDESGSSRSSDRRGSDKTLSSSSDSDSDSSSPESVRSGCIDNHSFAPTKTAVGDNEENRVANTCDQESFYSPTERVRSHYADTHLFSPLLSTIVGDESRPTDILDELNNLKEQLKAIAQTSNDNSKVLEELQELAVASIAVIKDLTAELFKCKEEIKKRNGLFTDMLHPDIEVPLGEPEQFDALVEKFRDKRLIDNLAKYMATIHNETDEEEFVKASMQTLFKFDFFMQKVTWKKEPNRVYIKKSKVLQCWRDSFKLKFDAKEPKKSDKEVNKFIHGVCRRYKDASRKAKRTDYD